MGWGQECFLRMWLVNTECSKDSAQHRRHVAQNQQVVLGIASNTAMSKTACRFWSRVQCVCKQCLAVSL